MSRRFTTLLAAAAVSLGLVTAGATSAQAAAKQTPNMGIKINHSSFVASQHGIVSVHLGGPGGGQKVTVYEVIPAHQPVAVAVLTTDAHGNASTKQTMVYNAYFRASWAGNAQWSAANKYTGWIKVSALVISVFSTKTKMSGGYHLVGKGKQAEFEVLVLPRKPGQKVSFPIEVYSGGKWRVKVDHAYKLTTITVDGQQVTAAGTVFHGSPGFGYRVRGEYHGDKYDGARNSAWSYVKFS